MYGQAYVWILHYGNDPQWMAKPNEDGACTAEQISIAAEGHFVTRDVTLRTDGVMPLANLVRSVLAILLKLMYLAIYIYHRKQRL